jgi:hypothetical protein
VSFLELSWLPCLQALAEWEAECRTMKIAMELLVNLSTDEDDESSMRIDEAQFCGGDDQIVLSSSASKLLGRLDKSRLVLHNTVIWITRLSNTGLVEVLLRESVSASLFLCLLYLLLLPVRVLLFKLGKGILVRRLCCRGMWDELDACLELTSVTAQLAAIITVALTASSEGPFFLVRLTVLGTVREGLFFVRCRARTCV